MGKTDLLNKPANPAEHPFLWGMRSEHVAQIVRNARERVFEPREVIFRQGEPANSIYLIHDGKVALEAHGPGGAHVELQTLEKGEVLGWSWLFAPFVWTLQAHAIEATRAIVLDGGQLLVACEEDHDLGYPLMRRVAHLVIQRLESVSRQVKDGTIEPPQPAPASSSWAWTEKPLAAALSEHPFMHGLKPAHATALSGLATQARFLAGETICKAGEAANRLYLIQHGRIGLQPPSGSRLTYLLGAGEALGWSWLYEPYQWHFDARATEDTVAIAFDGGRLRELCESDHNLGYDLMKRITQVVIRRLEAVRRHVLESGAKPAAGA